VPRLTLPPTAMNLMETDLAPSTAGKRTILVVDDFDDTRLLLKSWLEKKGFNIVEAENGNQAVSLAQQVRPDLIIMDMQMPELDGLAATRKIRSIRELDGIPVLAVSAYGEQQFRAEALAAGCSEYVSTPFEPDNLEQVINSFLPR
jgi:CheY-like chemotaxis protein